MDDLVANSKKVSCLDIVHDALVSHTNNCAQDLTASISRLFMHSPCIQTWNTFFWARMIDYSNIFILCSENNWLSELFCIILTIHRQENASSCENSYYAPPIIAHHWHARRCSIASTVRRQWHRRSSLWLV